MKKTRQIITYVILGILLMWLAAPIVRWTIGLTAYEWSIVPRAIAAYTESDSDTFAEYKNKIKEAISQMENEFLLNKSVSTSTIQNIKNLVQWGFDRLPDGGDIGTANKIAKQRVDWYLDLAMQNPGNSNHISNAISRVLSFIESTNISRITWDINAGPAEWNAPLSVSFRADGIKDGSNTTPSENNYIWWTRENGGYRRELGRGSSLSYTFTKEWTYTVSLDVISGSRNSKWKVDVLPLSVSKQIVVKPKLGEIVLLINGVNVSNMDTLKLSPTIGKMWVILDASASRAIGNGTISETTWEFGNGESSVNRWGPIVERQIYANQGWYILKLTIKTNDWQTFTKEIQLLVRDPAAKIKLDKNTGNIGEEISMSAMSYFSDTKNIEYSWQIQDENGKKIIKTGDGMNFKHKFDTVGSYIVSLIAKNPNGQQDQDSTIINIESRPPIVAIDSPKPVKNEKPNVILFDATKSYDPDSNSRKNLSYIWKLDDREITLDNIENNWAKGTYTFDSKWSHKISVTVANAYGKITTQESSFQVSSILSVNMVMVPKVAKRGEPINIIGQSNSAEFFEWNMGDWSAIVSGTDRTIQHIYNKSGIFDARLNVSRDGGNETNSITRKVYISDTDSPLAIIEASNASNSIIEEDGACNWNKAIVINRSDMTTFSASNSVNIDGLNNWLTYTWKYFWKARTTPTISEKFNELGCFPIELTVRSTKNGATNTSTQYIKLTNRPPELTNLSTSVDNTKKDSQKILVKVQTNGAIDPDGVITSYIWYYTTESDSEPQNVQITQKNEITFVLPNITEKYYFWVILEDNDGAKINSAESWQSPTPLIIDNSNGNIYLPIISLTAPKTTVNIGEKVRFSVDVKTIIPGVNITNKSEYAWDFDGDGRIDEKSTLPNIEHIYTRSGDFNMKVRVTNNGVSNSKYQTVHVKNKLQANVHLYKLPDNRIYIMNASEWSYDSAHWEVGSITSDSLSSITVDGSTTNGKLTVSSNNTDVSTTDIDFSKIETITGSGLLYQSFPRSNNDVITVKNPGDTISISMLGNTATNYAIDTDTTIDSSLDGEPSNDEDNKDNGSYNDGSSYVFHDINTNKREHTIRLALIKDGTVISTRSITIILDYIASSVEASRDLSGSGIAGLSNWDKNKLEELSKMIRELTNSDRIILMQRYNTLVENWNNPFDKAKSLIDIQEGIDSGSMDSTVKSKLSKIVDELLIGDAQVTDEVGVAAILIRDLIPKESPNHDVLLEKLTEIESHPTLLDINKKLGKEMLVIIETDTTIPDKYKGHIKNQLLVIINGGSASIPENTWSGNVVEDNSTNGGIFGFISGFVKVFFIIIGVILLIGVAAFILYRINRKGDTIGFQDFLIDAVFHSGKTSSTIDTTVTDAIVNGPPPIKEDPLNNYTPTVIQKNETIVSPIQQNENIVSPEKHNWDPKITESITQSLGNTQETPATILSENIPDWLKVNTNVVPTPTNDHLPQIENIPAEESISEPTKVIDIKNSEEKIPPVITSNEVENHIPDWIKNTSLASNEEINIESLVKWETPASLISKTSNPPEEERLPDWLMSSIQTDTTAEEEKSTPSSIPEEVIENKNPIKEDTTISTGNEKKKRTKAIKKEVIKVTDTPNPSNDTNNIPDWLK